MAEGGVLQMSEERIVVVISGPSGAGKSTIVRETMLRTGAEFSVSATTRRPRPNEMDGRDYHFISREAFQTMIESGELLEHAEVFDELYGTPREPVIKALSEGRTVLLDIDVQGACQVHQKMPSATFILIVPPDEEELSRRLHSRSSEPESELAQRLSEASAEIDAAKASGVYNHVIVNDDLEAAIEQMVEILNQ
jgi:guanylate kinase